MRRSRAFVLLGAVALLASSLSVAANEEGQASTGAIQLNFLYVHGVKNDDASRINAANSLADLKNSVEADIPTWISNYQAAHPGVTINVASATANLYTAPASPYHPSDSLDPTLMDDWEVGDPGCTTTRQGDPCTTAYEWRYRLVQEINRLFPSTAKNIILIGHSTGARVAFEVASNTGPAGVGTYDWGVQNKIAAVVSIQGMIDGLQPNRYNVVGPFDFVTTCKKGDVISFFGNASAPGNGWCEYAGNVSGVAAADWVAQNKRALGLISYNSCSPSLWTGESDGSLPYAAQASPFIQGLNMTPAPGQTYTVAYGRNYGSYCHSAITSAGDPNHAAAITNAKARLFEMLFTNASRVVLQGTQATAAPVPYQGWTPLYSINAACPDGETAIIPQLQVVGACKHPGFFDGDDHAIQQGWNVFVGEGCGGSYRWTQIHDPNNSHHAFFYWQLRSRLSEGGLVTILPPDQGSR
ncbi:MAG TPA: hypothetical protein VJ302_13465 [Blastocatellia bacterium]|nr:hypothetical protein [Blastocatellia bacterium]